MRMKRLLIGTIAALSGFVSMACGTAPGEGNNEETLSESQSALARYPTKWTLTNNTTQELTFNCICPKPRGLSRPFILPPTTVGAGQSTIHTWSGIFNDGLGLNACEWNCSTTAGGSTHATTSFNTTWGQHLTLTAQPDGQLVLQ